MLRRKQGAGSSSKSELRNGTDASNSLGVYSANPRACATDLPGWVLAYIDRLAVAATTVLVAVAKLVLRSDSIAGSAMDSGTLRRKCAQ